MKVTIEPMKVTEYNLSNNAVTYEISAQSSELDRLTERDITRWHWVQAAGKLFSTFGALLFAGAVVCSIMTASSSNLARRWTSPEPPQMV